MAESSVTTPARIALLATSDTDLLSARASGVECVEGDLEDR